MAEHQVDTPQRLSGVRKVIAQRMLASLQGAAQLTFHGDADITALMTTRKEWKAAGHKISLEDCLIYALIKTLEAFPGFNGVADEASYTQHSTIDLSLAITTSSGLMTPVLRNIRSMSLIDLAKTRRDLVSRALSGKLAVSEMKGGSFTLSNLGHTRVRYFTPILNAGQLALLGVGRLDEVAEFDEAGHVRPVRKLPLSLTADHRFIDGEPAGKFLSELCEQLEKFHVDP